ncbi:unnamed protein product [Notodromas monacha]|uniref:Uncharacterized protein n=1 Tax=Notodromas monacha TaxID=399045 RepID=A0A7R9BI31_9CRUS|nr:unnamed protein product [Notodromas monacha]CAG0915122.1 unnamed protein product [Notodromas monacha]
MKRKSRPKLEKFRARSRCPSGRRHIVTDERRRTQTRRDISSGSISTGSDPASSGGSGSSLLGVHPASSAAQLSLRRGRTRVPEQLERGNVGHVGIDWTCSTSTAGTTLPIVDFFPLCWLGGYLTPLSPTYGTLLPGEKQFVHYYLWPAENVLQAVLKSDHLCPIPRAVSVLQFFQPLLPVENHLQGFVKSVQIPLCPIPRAVSVLQFFQPLLPGEKQFVHDHLWPAENCLQAFVESVQIPLCPIPKAVSVLQFSQTSLPGEMLCSHHYLWPAENCLQALESDQVPLLPIPKAVSVLQFFQHLLPVWTSGNPKLFDCPLFKQQFQKSDCFFLVSRTDFIKTIKKQHHSLLLERVLKEQVFQALFLEF